MLYLIGLDHQAQARKSDHPETEEQRILAAAKTKQTQIPFGDDKQKRGENLTSERVARI